MRRSAAVSDSGSLFINPIRTALGLHLCVTGNLDIATGAAVAAADARTATAALGCDLAAIDFDRAAVSIAATADARTECATFGCNFCRRRR